MLGARTTVTPFHHQPEAQHPKFLAIHKNAGRLPHLLAPSGHFGHAQRCLLSGVKRWTFRNVRFLRPVLVLLLMPTGLVEAIEHRQDILNIFGIGVRIVKGIEQRVVLGTQLCLQVI
jgi:hypothetical protein